MSKNDTNLEGWSLLTHGGLLVDAPRLRQLAATEIADLSHFLKDELRRRYLSFIDNRKNAGDWIAFVLEKICGFQPETGIWLRANQIGTEWSKPSLTGEIIRPRHLWKASTSGVLPVFINDDIERIGLGRGRKAVSNTLQWMRASGQPLALLTNGRQWRLLYAGLDAEAWCEWDAERWFEEGDLGLQVSILRIFLSPGRWRIDSSSRVCPLLQAIQDSRKGQAELSALLGERVRESVEILVQAHGEQLRELGDKVNPSDIYRAAVRVIMRMVVVFFAESRDLLPRSNSLYHRGYGLNGLLEDLEKFGGPRGDRLAHTYSAWPRVLSLFRMVYAGSPHASLPIHAYGGELFESGDAGSSEGLRKALAVFETACFDHQLMSDLDVRLLLERISRTKVKVRQGKGATWVNVPVDFADLSSEYIGILYEGLLDFELKTAPAEDPVIFLAVGNEPALPLSRLEAMDDGQLKSLLEKMKDTSKKGDDEETQDEEEAEPEESAENPADIENEWDEPADDVPAEEVQEGYDLRHNTRSKAEQWALRVVHVAGLVKKPSAKASPEKLLAYEKALAQKAKALVKRVILPGEWFLVRWGGTRKGSGSFYTRPGLAIPTVHRTLRPLAYHAPLGADGQPNHLAPATDWTPRLPEEILHLKVCDPACGSGSFPVAALRFLTDALYKSLHHHGRIARQEGDRSIISLLNDGKKEENISTELIPCPPDDDSFEPRLRARLRRHVVERCIYGVDLDPLAAELCRLALWVETMDRNLPFSFLDHKIKCGNGLVGAWFDQFQHYPVMAWKNREAGDKSHSNGVHYQKEERTKAIRQWVKDVLTPDLRLFLEGRTLFSADLHAAASNTHEEALSVLNRLHALPVHDSAERARIYRTELAGSPAYQRLKAAMDLWCACWFWPAEALERAPLPSTLAAPTDDTVAMSAFIAGQKRFFHWELEFPDVFRKAGDGFDAMVGNPPWETAKPNSKEFYSNIDPLYRTYGKQEAIRKQTEYFSNKSVESEWLEYSADYRAQSNFVGYAGFAFGDASTASNASDKFNIRSGSQNTIFHDKWRKARNLSQGYADTEHGYLHQGSGDVNLYKLFLEQGHALLRKEGRMGFIVPSGIYSDFGTAPLRRKFLDNCNWEWLFGFENRNKVFEIDSRFKFNPIIVCKSGSTKAVNTAFMRRNLEDWEHAEALAIPYSRTQVERFSPKSLAILEIQSQKDLEILEKIYSNSVLLGDEGPNGWGVKYGTEFHMTNDSKLFPPRPKWEEKGYQPDEYSRWLLGKWRPITELWSELGVQPLAEGETRLAQPPYDTLPIPRADIPEGIILNRDASKWIREEEVEDVALPLYEGRMIGQFDFSQKGWVSGKGRTAVWRDISWDLKVVEPQYLMGRGNFLPEYEVGYKIPIMNIGSSTNSRTLIAGLVRNVPCNHSLNPIRVNTFTNAVNLNAVLNSYIIDFELRMRLGGLNISFFVLDELATLMPKIFLNQGISALSKRLSIASIWFSINWIESKLEDLNAWRFYWALTSFERTRIGSALDALIASLAGLNYSDFKEILRETDLPLKFTEVNRNPKGFYRIDKDKDPELRHTVLSMVAFHDLQEKIAEAGGDREKGIEAFLNQNNGEGWMIPETLRLADYGLGHDERAQQHQPVASRMGPRFYDWQLAQPSEESWKECHLHARNQLGRKEYETLLLRIEAEKRGEVFEPDPVPEAPAVNRRRNNQQQIEFDF